jgi:hypothetical protein
LRFHMPFKFSGHRSGNNRLFGANMNSGFCLCQYIDWFWSSFCVVLFHSHHVTVLLFVHEKIKKHAKVAPFHYYIRL